MRHNTPEYDAQYYLAHREFLLPRNRESAKRWNRSTAGKATRKAWASSQEGKLKLGASRGRYRLGLKRQLVLAYGGCCACCGESRMGFLTLDHSFHDGKAHRVRLGNRDSRKMYAELRRLGWPKDKGYRILCFNCNMATRYPGDVCPHKMALDTSDVAMV